MTKDAYRALYERQHGRCGICGIHEDELQRPQTLKGRRSTAGVLHVDHDHITGGVRGLLCYRCNAGMAWVDRIGLEHFRELVVGYMATPYDHPYKQADRFLMYAER